MSRPSPDPVYAHTVGNLADAQAMIGIPSSPVAGPFCVDEVRIAQFCSMIQSDSDLYRRPPEQTGDGEPKCVAPPASLQVWVRQLPWNRDGKVARSMLACVPLPGTSMINVSTDTVYERSIDIGDVISIEEEIAAISELKSTRLGDGHFVTAVGRYHNQHGDLIATCTNVLFRFEPRGGES